MNWGLILSTGASSALVIGLLVGVAACSRTDGGTTPAATPAPADPATALRARSRPVRVYTEGITVYVDPDTGCQYLLHSNGITPRMTEDTAGNQYVRGCR